MYLSLHLLGLASWVFCLSSAAAYEDQPACWSTKVMDALKTSRPRAKRFCHSFMASDVHHWYPAFIAAAFEQPSHPPKEVPSGNAAIDDAILSSACNSYMGAMATEGPTVASMTEENTFDQSWSLLDNTKPSRTAESHHGGQDDGHHDGSYDHNSNAGDHDRGEDSDGEDPPADQMPGPGGDPPDTPLQPLPSATLIPVLRIEHDPSNITNLQPQDSAALFYAEQSYKTNPFLKHMYADMNVSFSYPTVVIDSTHFLTNMACHLSSNEADQTGGTLVYEVETKAAFDTIDETWSREKDLVLVIQGEDCETTENGTRAYFLGHLDTLSWSDEEDKGILEFVGDEILLEEGITDASLEWGTRIYNSDTMVGAAVPTESVNRELCSKSSPFNRKAVGIPAVNPCSASFDLALDQAYGYSYIPVATRYDRTRQLLVNAEAREDVIVDYINNQLGTATMRIRWRRLLGFGSIWRGTRQLGDAVWQGIVEVGKAFDAAGDKSINCFRNLPTRTSAAAKRIGRMVYDGLRTAGPGLIESFRSLRTYLIESARNISRLGVRGLDDLDKRIQSWNPNMNVNMDIDLAPPRLTDSPWGDAWLLVKMVSNSPKRPKSKGLSPPPPQMPHVPHQEPSPPSMHHTPHEPPQLPKPHSPFGARSPNLQTTERGTDVHSHLPHTPRNGDDDEEPHDPGYRTGDPIKGELGKHRKHGAGGDHYHSPHHSGPDGGDNPCHDGELRRRIYCDGDHHERKAGEPGRIISPLQPGKHMPRPVVGGDGNGHDKSPDVPGFEPDRPRHGGQDQPRERGDGEFPGNEGNPGDGEDGDKSDDGNGPGSDTPVDPGMRTGDPGRRRKPKPEPKPDPGHRSGDGFLTPKPRGSTNRGSRGTRQRQFKVYCLGCGIHSHNRVSGQARFSLLHGAQALNIGLEGGYQYGMGVGLVAESERNVPGKQRHIIPPISTPLTTIKGVMTFGPIMSLAVGVSSRAHQQGQIAAGINMEVPSYTANFDFVHPSNSGVKGFRTAHINRYFTGSVAMSQNSNVNMPFAVGVGVMIPMIKLDKRAKIVNKPTVNVQAVMSGTYAKGARSPPPGITLQPDTKCDGMTYAVAIAHEIDLVMLDKWSKNVFKYQVPIKTGCYKPGSPRASPPGRMPRLESDDTETEHQDDYLKEGRDLQPRESGNVEVAEDELDSPLSEAWYVDEDSVHLSLDDHDRPTILSGESHKYKRTDTTVTDTGTVPHSNFRDLGASWGPMAINSPPAYLDRPKLIVDSTRTLALVSTLDGNVYLIPFMDAMHLPERNASLVFADLTHVGPRWVNPQVKNRYVGSHARTLMTDGFDRGFHYFPATMAKYGVSRVRMLDVDQVPTGAAQTIMEYGKLGKRGQLGFYFVDAQSPFTAAFPVACLVRDAQGIELPKLFAVNDVTRGLKSLAESKEIASAVTGGIVSNCQFVHLVEVLCNTQGKDPRECRSWQAATHVEHGRE